MAKNIIRQPLFLSNLSHNVIKVKKNETFIMSVADQLSVLTTASFAPDPGS
jgi:hypothetical protein